PVTAVDSGINSSVTSIAGAGLSATTGGVTISGVSFNAGSSIGVTLPAGYTTALPVNNCDFSGFGASGYKTISTSGTETPSTSWSGTANAAVLVANFQAVSGNQTLSAGFGAFSLTGEAATLSQGGGGSQTILAATGAFNITGAPSTSGTTIIANPGLFIVASVGAVLTWPQGGLSDPGNLVYRKVFVITPSGSQKPWVDYIPCIFVQVTAQKANRYDF